MSRKFQVKVIPSDWLKSGGYRLDCGPYLSGAIEARELLKKQHTERLDNITKGYNGGIYNGPQFSRNYVDAPEFGVPFLTTSTMQQADTSNLPLLSKNDAYSTKLRFLEVAENMTLITCSGSIGKIVYSRKDMAGTWSNQDIMKVVADTSKILPGYLNAFLAGRFGIPLVIGGTYGAIIQHIEPSHLVDLPVPRLGAVEEKAHGLVQRAADLMVESSTIYKKAADMINQQFSFPEKLAMSARVFAFSVANSNSLFSRLDATFHNPTAQQAEQLVLDTNGITLNDAGVRGFESNRLKQIFVDEEFGTPFITSGGIFLKSIEPERFIRTQSLGDDEESWRINQQDILLARSGQVGGIIGRGVWSDARFDGIAASPHIIRLRATDNDYPAGYVFAFLCLTDIGYQLLSRTAAGSSIPYLPLDAVLKIRIPTSTTKEFREDIHNMVVQAGMLRGQSQKLEKDAVLLVEQAIEKGGQ